MYIYIYIYIYSHIQISNRSSLRENLCDPCLLQWRYSRLALIYISPGFYNSYVFYQDLCRKSLVVSCCFTSMFVHT